jgi:hypothetical protein
MASSEIRIPAKCGTCGQVDDHPKLHYGQLQFHHDCIPAFVMEDLTSESTWEHQDDNGWVLVDRIPLADEDLHPAAQEMLKIVKKCKSGTKGDALRKFITKED